MAGYTRWEDVKREREQQAQTAALACHNTFAPFEFEDTPEQKQAALEQLEEWRKEARRQQIVADIAGVSVEDLDSYGGWPHCDKGIGEDSMRMELTFVHELPAEFTFTTELGQDQWAQADADRRNDIISDAMDAMVMMLLEEKKIRLACVKINGVEYDEQ